MKKCPSCNSSKYKEDIVDGKPVRSCQKCGFVNKIDGEENKTQGQISLGFGV